MNSNPRIIDPDYRCNECGEEWIDGGELTCPFCDSCDFTEIEYEDDAPMPKRARPARLEDDSSTRVVRKECDAEV